MSPCGPLALEGAMDLSQDRLRDDDSKNCDTHDYRHEIFAGYRNFLDIKTLAVTCAILVH